ncbi:MAG: GTPase/DUF3482 domain-containing protein [Chromatiaceae bacterium]|jgi:hypothetical protein
MASAAAEIPRLAIMGHPNAGKSSVVATLTENDRIAIDKRAGTTTESNVYPVIIDGETVIEFIDTPGFQNPSAILEWFQGHPTVRDLPKEFLKAHKSDPLFAHDCDLLEPVARGAGMVLVLDGSKRIKEKDRIEIELMRLTARPRMAILNNLTRQTRYMAQWHQTLSKAFNSVREFNAHRATYAERINLLNALKSIDQRWENRVARTIEAFERDWDRRMDQATETIIDLLKDALAYRASAVVKEADMTTRLGWNRVKGEVMAELENGLRRLETEAQQQIRSHFRHHVWDQPPESVLSKDLLSEDVNRALGLSRRQLALAGLTAGAATGAGIDLALAGSSLGAAAFLGATAGGLLGLAGGRTLAKLNIEVKPGTQRFTAGPVSNPKFPFILLDRILLYSARAMNWAHGRQAADEDSPEKVPDRETSVKGFAEELSLAEQRDLTKFFADARRGKGSDREDACRDIIKRILHDLSAGRIDSRAEL